MLLLMIVMVWCGREKDDMLVALQRAKGQLNRIYMYDLGNNGPMLFFT